MSPLFGRPFVSVGAAVGYADGLGTLADAVTHVLRAVERRRVEAARKWLWDNRERAAVVEDGAGRRLRFADLADADREAVAMWRDVIVGLLRDDPDVARWFARVGAEQPETPSRRGPSHEPSGAV
jgi:hypothetical protein